MALLSSLYSSSNTKAAPKKAPGNLIPAQEETLRMELNTQRVHAVRGLAFPASPQGRAFNLGWSEACEQQVCLRARFQRQ